MKNYKYFATCRLKHMRKVSQRIYLSSIFSSRNNGLNLIRLLASVVVLYSHIGWIAGADTPWIRMLGPKAVAIFFGISGFLIFNSWEHSHSLKVFVFKRFIRLWPAFSVVLFLTAFVFYPFSLMISPGSQVFRFSGDQLNYVLSNILFHPLHSDILPTPISTEVNNWNPSLYTLEFEVACYALTPLLFTLLLRVKKKFLQLFLLVTGLIICQYLLFFGIELIWVTALLYFLRFYLIGAICFFYADRIVVTYQRVTILISLISLSVYFGVSESLILFLLIPLSLMIGALIKSGFFAKNDFSYGVYIYAGPITHLVVLLMRNQSFVLINSFLVTLLITIGFASFSWYCVERNLIKYKFKQI